VQEKAIAHPTDARLTHRAIEKLVELAKRAAIMVGRYTHAHQFNRARREPKFLRTRLGRIIRDIHRKIEGNTALEDRFGPLLDLALRVRHQEQHQRGPKGVHRPRQGARAVRVRLQGLNCHSGHRAQGRAVRASR
jgi:IS5 family transposase